MENENKYQMFTLLGNEFTFDVDMSKVGCGLNGALYFVSVSNFSPTACALILLLLPLEANSHRL